MNLDRIEADGKNCFLHFEFCADGFVDDMDKGQTFNFGKKPSLRNCLRCFQTELSGTERIVSYLYII